jgi:hypothetical protein
MVKQDRNAQANRFWLKSIPEESDLQLSTILSSSQRVKLNDPRITLVCTRLGEKGLLKGGLGHGFSPAETQAQTPSKVLARVK